MIFLIRSVTPNFQIKTSNKHTKQNASLHTHTRSSKLIHKFDKKNTKFQTHRDHIADKIPQHLHKTNKHKTLIN